MMIFLKRLLHIALTPAEKDVEMARLTAQLEKVKQQRRELAREMSNG